MAPLSCKPLIHDEPVRYKDAPAPWPLNTQLHPFDPSRLGQSNFCACLWSRIPPAPSTVYTPIWSPRADTILSVLWFHSHMHEAIIGTWTRAWYHEALSIILGCRVSQHVFFERVRYMRKYLPQCWLDACMEESTSEVVTAIFRDLNEKWSEFTSKFEMWGGYELYQDEIVEAAGSATKSEKQWDRVMELNGDVDSLFEKGEEKPARVQAYVHWIRKYCGRKGFVTVPGFVVSPRGCYRFEMDD